MAEYKGLTIRIGGDTSQLNSALKASTKAASSLQSQIRRITTAMRFDPSSIGVIDTRMKLTTNRAESLYSKLNILKSGYKELGESVVGVGSRSLSVRKLAEATDNASLSAQTAKKRYTDMTETLASRYRELEARAKEAGKSMNLNALSRQGSDSTFEKQMAELKQLGVITDDEIAKLREMRSTWREAFGESEAYKAVETFRDMEVNMQRVEAEAKSLVANVRELNGISNYSATSWELSNSKIRSMDESMGEAAKRAKEYEAAIRENPSNLDAALGRLRALSDELGIAESKQRELAKQVSGYRERLASVIAEHRNIPQYVQETGDKWEKVQRELAEAEGKASSLRQSLQRIKDAQMPDEEVMKLEAQVAKAERRVSSLKEEARGMDAAFETAKECSELQQLETELARTSSHAEKLRKRMDMQDLGGKSFLNASTVKSLGMTLYSTLTPAITMLGWRAMSAAQDMDSAYRDMRKTVDGTEAQFEALKRGAIEFSKTHVTSAEQLLQIEAIGGELGVATDSLQAFAETVSNLEVATNLGTSEAAESLGTLANITHMGADEYERYGDALVRLGNNGASTEDQIVDIATRIGSMGTIVGMSVPEILALSSAIAGTGMKTEASGTAIANTISNMESAVSKGGDALEGFAEVSGMSADEFAKTWEDKPIEAFKAFVQGLNEIEKQGGSADVTLQKLGINGTRQKQAIEGLMQTIGGLDDSLTMSNDAWNGVSDEWGAAGDAAREAEKKAEGFSGQVAILSNVANDAMASLAEGSTPLLSILTDIAQNALGVFEGMSDGGKSAAVGMLALGAAAGPVLTLTSTLMTATDNVKGFLTSSNAMARAVKLFKQGMDGAPEGVSRFTAAMEGAKMSAASLGKSLAHGLAAGAVVVGIAAVTMAIADYVRKMDEAAKASRNAGNIMEEALGKGTKEAVRNTQTLSSSYDDLVRKMAETNEGIQRSADETFGKTANLAQYGDEVKRTLEAYNAGDDSASAMADLKTALDLYNDAAGTSISLTKDANGKLTLMKDGAELSAKGFDRLTQSMKNNAKAEFFKSSYEAKMGDQRAAMEQVANAQKAQKEAQEAYDEALKRNDPNLKHFTDALSDADKVLAESKKKLDETQSSMNQYEEGMKLMAEAQERGAGAGTKWVAENDELQASIWANSQSVTDFAHALDTLGISSKEMDANKDVLSEMAMDWDGSISSLLPGINEMGIELDEATRKAWGLSQVTIGDKTFYVSDEGTLGEAVDGLVELQEIEVEGKTYTVTDDGTIFDGIQKVGRLKGSVATIGDKTFEVDADTSKADTKVAGSKKRADSTKGTMKVDADTKKGSEKIGSLVAAANGKSAKVKVKADTSSFWSGIRSIVGNVVGTAKVKVAKSATGSVAGSPYIPRHAKGYIATGPTLTNNGWVGEAGAEAVLNWGTGGAVVPLTNRNYMLPIADAIADGLDRRGGDRPSVTINISVDGRGNEDSKLAKSIAREVELALRRL